MFVNVLSNRILEWPLPDTPPVALVRRGLSYTRTVRLKSNYRSSTFEVTQIETSPEEFPIWRLCWDHQVLATLPIQDMIPCTSIEDGLAQLQREYPTESSDLARVVPLGARYASDVDTTEYGTGRYAIHSQPFPTLEVIVLPLPLFVADVGLYGTVAPIDAVVRVLTAMEANQGPILMSLDAANNLRSKGDLLAEGTSSPGPEPHPALSRAGDIVVASFESERLFNLATVSLRPNAYRKREQARDRGAERRAKKIEKENDRTRAQSEISGAVRTLFLQLVTSIDRRVGSHLGWLHVNGTYSRHMLSMLRLHARLFGDKAHRYWPAYRALALVLAASTPELRTLCDIHPELATYFASNPPITRRFEGVEGQPRGHCSEHQFVKLDRAYIDIEGQVLCPACLRFLTQVEGLETIRPQSKPTFITLESTPVG